MDNAVSEQGGETTRLGSFEIVRKLARGGMAEIFLARTRGPSGFEKLVVLKKILPRYADKPRFVQLFLDEARLAASLDHPNIAQVYDIGMIDGSYFFTMEYLHGQDVRSTLHRTWSAGELFPIEHAVQIARHVAAALHFAHEKRGSDGTLLGIVHRDVSPSNVIVTYDGATKLLDFGVAKTTTSTVKTRTGTLKGKVSYMSPEQARGASLDRRSDIFSLGIVMWEMVTTQRLYRGDNDLATLQLIINQPAEPPSKIRPDCPPELERIVMRALARDLDARYTTAEQVVTELDELAREHKFKQSPNALAAMMNQLFNTELAAWHDARAAGVPLADHLHDAVETPPVSESAFVEIEAIEDEIDEELEDDDNDKTEHAAPFMDLLAEDPRPAGEALASPPPREIATHLEPTETAPRSEEQAAGESGAGPAAGDSATYIEPTGQAPRLTESAPTLSPVEPVAAEPRSDAPATPATPAAPAAPGAEDAPTLRPVEPIAAEPRSDAPAASTAPGAPAAPAAPAAEDAPTLRPVEPVAAEPRPGAESPAAPESDEQDAPTVMLNEQDAAAFLAGDQDSPTVMLTEQDASVLLSGDLDAEAPGPREPAPRAAAALDGDNATPTGLDATISRRTSQVTAPVTGLQPIPVAPVTVGPPIPSTPGTGRHPVARASSVLAVPGALAPPAPAPSVTPRSSAAVLVPPVPPSSVPLAVVSGVPTTSSAPFAVPPWQSGRPGLQVAPERTDRSWAVVELPAFDPDLFERRRRIVVRVALGVVGFIVLLAILAGRC